ncbi:CRISPR-associated endonuclease Cas1 [Pseudonocardia alni]|uniref:CRISPR-associated endonuclease Cas1 n=1 Tax=Pseudonocardia alni TaxID=33907 RepID=UPI0033E517E0
MGELFSRAFTQQALLSAWVTVRDAALDDGEPDREVEFFERRAAGRVVEIAEQQAAGTWRPDPVRRVTIPKPGGGQRVLGIPPLADRVVERALLAVLDPVVDPLLLPWSFAYRRGLGPKDAVAALADARDEGAAWVARSDVRDFFTDVPQWEVLRRLREVVDDERVVHLVGMLLDRRVEGGRVAPADRGLGLHQGSVLSPLLSNLYLHEFDRRMLAAGHRVIRYGDDFAIPVATRRDGERALLTAGTELTDLRLEINSGKSHVVSFDDGVRFLGSTVTATTLAAGDAVSHPIETSVYVDRQGALVRVRGDRLVVVEGEESLLRLNLKRVRQVVCYGRVGLTTAFLHRAAERGIEVVLLTEHGAPAGRLSGPLTSDPTVRRAQYRTADDDADSRRIAAQFVAGKIDNMRVSLLRFARRNDDVAASTGADRLRSARDSLATAITHGQLLGMEGAATREYFQSAARSVDDSYGFRGRQRRPPPDPVNAMLSYGYTLLVQECIGALDAAGLDPMVGFLHRHRWGRPALALDLVEEFRPITVDVVVWRCVATRHIRPEQFTTVPEQGSRMSDDARHAFLAAYERRMLTLVTHPGAGRRLSLRVAIAAQAKELAAVVQDRTKTYRAFRWK